MSKILTLDDAKKRIIIPFDYDTIEQIDTMMEPIYSFVKMVKFGKQVYARIGLPVILKHMREKWPNVKVFVDDKTTDISNTLGQQIKAVLEFPNIGMFNIALPSSGDRAIHAVTEAVKNANRDVLVMGYGVPTDMPKEEAARIFNRSYPDIIREVLAERAIDTGCNGIICSASDIQYVPAGLQKQLLFATPGVRPKWAATDDQDPNKIMTPTKAILAGSNYVIVGRPITKPPKESGYTPEGAFDAIAEEIFVTSQSA